MLTCRDGVADLTIGNILNFHRSHGRLATVTAVRPISRFGTVEVNGGGQMLRSAEKPRSHAWINAGFFIFEQEIFAYLQGGDACILEHDRRRRTQRLPA